MRAVAENREVAYLMGVDLNRIVSLTFLIGSALAGVGGVLIGLYYTQIDFFLGWFAGLKAFTAAVLGGIGNIRGAMLGGLALGIIESLGVTVLSLTAPVTGFGVAYKDMIAFAVLIAVLVFRPTGILGERVSERV
jgi:branched-chain amino acid transport system permease protein